MGGVVEYLCIDTWCKHSGLVQKHIFQHITYNFINYVTSFKADFLSSRIMWRELYQECQKHTRAVKTPCQLSTMFIYLLQYQN